MRSPTRSVREPCAISGLVRPLCQPVERGPNDKSRISPFDLLDHRVQRVLDPCLRLSHGDDGETCTLPEILVIDLRDGNVQLPEPVLDAAQDGPLVLERPCARKVKLEREEPNDRHGGCVGDVRRLMVANSTALDLHRRRHLLDRERLDDVAKLYVAVLLERDPAFDPSLDLADVILEPT